LTAVLMTPGTPQRLHVVAPCALVTLALAVFRLVWLGAFERRYAHDPGRWRRNFDTGVYTSAAVWVVFALQQMTASGATWPTWMILLMTAGLSAGAVTSLAPDGSLLDRCLVLLLSPLSVWGIVHGGADGAAIALMVAVHLVFLLFQ